LRLRLFGALSRQEGLRSARAVRNGARLRDRDAGDSSESGHLNCGYRGWHVCLHGDSYSALPARTDGERDGTGGLDVRGARGVDGLSGVLRGVWWHPTTPYRSEPRYYRALWPLPGW